MFFEFLIYELNLREDDFSMVHTVVKSFALELERMVRPEAISGAPVKQCPGK